MAAFVETLETWRQAIREARDPKRPPVFGWKIPLLGCALEFQAKGPELIREAYARYGDTFTLYLGGRLITFCRDEAFKRHLYGAGVEEVSFFAALETFSGFGTLVALGASGPEHANVGLETLRKFIGPRVRAAPAEVDAELMRRIAGLGGQGEVDLVELFEIWIVALSAKVLVGPELARDEAFLRDMVAYDHTITRVARTPTPGLVIRAGMQIRERLLGKFIAEFERRRRAPDPDHVPDFADAMLAATDPQGQEFSDEVVALELLGYLFATSANTPAAAAQCMLHVLADPALHDRLLAEQRALIEDHGDRFDQETLASMPVLTACFHETLRMYAPSMHVRLCYAPSQAGEYELPGNRMIAFSPFALHHDPAIYSDPDVFDPDRFLAGPRTPGKAPQAAHFIAFGRGPHACLGKNLARVEIVASVARLLRELEFEPVAPLEPGRIHWVTNGVASNAGPRRVRYRRRPLSAGERS